MRGWRRACVEGDAVICSDLRARLVREPTLARVPVPIGAGLPLFAGLPGDVALPHRQTRSLADGPTQSHDRRRGG